MISPTPSSEKDPVSRLIFELSKLPGIGEKTATRLSYFILKQDASYSQALSEALMAAKKQTQLCKTCFNFTDQIQCQICRTSDRDETVLCVVEKPADVMAIDQAGIFRGFFHVLHGAISPLDGIGPEELKIRELLQRISDSKTGISEVILAMNPSVEGDATSLYLSKLLQPLNIRLTRLAHGLPAGGTLEYSDRQTIGKAIENRMELNS